MTELVAPPEWFSSARSRGEELFADIVETATTETMDGYGALLVGEPYDRSVVSKRGTEQGPSALREALATTPIPPGSPGATRSVADIGTIGIPARRDDGSVQETIRSFTGRVHGTDTVPVFLGGDSSLTFPNVVPAIERGTVGVVRFDSYPALDGAPKSGTSYRRLFESGLESLAVLGARNVGPTLSTGNYIRAAESYCDTGCCRIRPDRRRRPRARRALRSRHGVREREPERAVRRGSLGGESPDPPGDLGHGAVYNAPTRRHAQPRRGPRDARVCPAARIR